MIGLFFMAGLTVAVASNAEGVAFLEVQIFFVFPTEKILLGE